MERNGWHLSQNMHCNLRTVDGTAKEDLDDHRPEDIRRTNSTHHLAMLEPSVVAIRRN